MRNTSFAVRVCGISATLALHAVLIAALFAQPDKLSLRRAVVEVGMPVLVAVSPDTGQVSRSALPRTMDAAIVAESLK